MQQFPTSPQITIIHRTIQQPKDTLTTNVIRRDQERFSYAPTTRQFTPLQKFDYKYSLGQNVSQPLEFGSSQLINNEIRETNTSAYNPEYREERPSISNVSYQSIDNKYGLVVRKIERQSIFAFQSTVFSNKRYSEDIDPLILQENFVKNSGKEQNSPSPFFDKEDSLQNKRYFERIVQSDRSIFKRVSVDQYKPEKVNLIQPMLQDLRKQEVQVQSSLLKTSSKTDEVQNLSNKSTAQNKLINADLGTYAGDIINGMMNGQGQILDTNNFVVYDGGFKDNAFDGYGILYNPIALELKEKGLAEFQIIDNEHPYMDLDYVGSNWQRYEGIFRNDKKHKIGFWHLNSGDVFFGEFDEDKASGYGVYTMARGFSIGGIWKDNKLVENL